MKLEKISEEDPDKFKKIVFYRKNKNKEDKIQIQKEKAKECIKFI